MILTKFLDLNGLQRVTENIRLRMDSKQDKLIGLSGQIVGFGTKGVGAVSIQAGNNIELTQDGTDLTVSAAVSNPNLLDNWYFINPINQHGVTTWTRGYGIDRWYGEGLSATLESDGLSLERTGSAIAFIQPWELERIKKLIGKTLTLSLLTTTSLSYCVFQIAQDESGVCKTIQIANVVADLEIFGSWINSSAGIYQMARIVPKLNKRITLIAAKLELGSAQTLAHQDTEGNWVLNDAPPDKTLELLKCQRYYQVFTSQDLRPVKAADFRPAMRINPTLGTLVLDGETYYTADANL